jgi:hypothetical protein
LGAIKSHGKSADDGRLESSARKSKAPNNLTALNNIFIAAHGDRHDDAFFQRSAREKETARFASVKRLIFASKKRARYASRHRNERG